MQTKRYDGSTLQYLAIEPDGYDPARKYPMVILLHGFGAHMGDLAGLAPAIDAAGYVYICPNAPIPFQIGPGMTGFGWTPPRDARSADDLERAADMLAALVDDATAQYPTETGQIILCGFSQGGMMTYRCGLPNPHIFKGLAVLSGVAPGVDELRRRLPDERAQPIFVVHGAADMVLPIDSARDAVAFLRAEGYQPQYAEYPMAHEISQQTLTDLAVWIKSVLPPAQADA